MSSSSANRDHTYCRKEKSLSLLCTNFLKHCDRDGVETIGLDEAAAKLGVERRRIYDIVNVLESVGVLSKKAKNQYSWKGFEGIPKALEELQGKALRETCGHSAVNSYDCTKGLDDDGNAEDENLLVPSRGELRRECSNLSSDLNGDSLSCSHSSKVKADNRKEKSLGLLTQNFVKLFLTANVDTVTLDEAARLLLGDSNGSSMLTNNSAAKVRRLYDIANVLTSLNLIEKTQQIETRRPAFRWLGYNGKPDNAATFSTRAPNDQSKKRVFGSDVTNLDLVKRRPICTMDEKPIRVQMKSKDPSAQKQSNQMQQQQPSSKGYDFGPFRPVLQDREKAMKSTQNCKAMASSHRPQYRNQALSELFAHYSEAWKSWYMEVTQVNNLKPERKAIH
ncbi:E2F transcription factor-like protein E2FE isoform X1 [Cinnamomum micranthum f. kanehirae]|uniref:E2F transcription factor-like protein E2FE isoform X1 n=1 Tax=Cinnamomum micranthum f. kanehirae TaxID=337451 RepID=A0A443NJG8_9MAGN|nr:E2F transcription factor-like protein E2FE isoform X1 [Cinnamomum micranthum f. kanehirae]